MDGGGKDPQCYNEIKKSCAYRVKSKVPYVFEKFSLSFIG